MDTAHLEVDEELSELANLEPEKTGVDGFVYVSTAVHAFLNSFERLTQG